MVGREIDRVRKRKIEKMVGREIDRVRGRKFERMVGERLIESEEGRLREW
jgi:hypothetical protein